jgi:peptidoglycan/xylan/chitin deacetylase (PgdA/CDA1 family)
MKPSMVAGVPGPLLGVAAAAARALARLRGPGYGVALVYHRIAAQTGEEGRELLPAIATDDLDRQARHLARHYQVVAAHELLAAARARRRGQRIPVAVTFDDDALAHLQVAAPVLRAAGVPATFFLCGASLDAPHAFWWERLQRLADAERLADTELPGVADADRRGTRAVFAVAAAIEAMTPERRDAVWAALGEALGPDPADAGLRAPAVAELAGLGFEIGFHTRSHDPFDTVDDSGLERALRYGREELAALAGGPLRTVAYPDGRTDARTAAAARAAGFEVGYTTSGEPLRPGGDPYLIGRFEPRSPTIGVFALKLGVATWRRA